MPKKHKNLIKKTKKKFKKFGGSNNKWKPKFKINDCLKYSIYNNMQISNILINSKQYEVKYIDNVGIRTSMVDGLPVDNGNPLMRIQPAEKIDCNNLIFNALWSTRKKSKKKTKKKPKKKPKKKSKILKQ